MNCSELSTINSQVRLSFIEGNKKSFFLNEIVTLVEKHITKVKTTNCIKLEVFLANLLKTASEDSHEIM